MIVWSQVTITILNQHKQNESNVCVLGGRRYLVFIWYIQRAKKEVNTWPGQKIASYYLGLDLRNRKSENSLFILFFLDHTISHYSFSHCISSSSFSFLLSPFFFSFCLSTSHQLVANWDIFTPSKDLKTVLIGSLWKLNQFTFVKCTWK